MIRLGISACLLGRKVRYDGGHKRDDFLLGVLARHVEFVPVCPEAESGLGVPREPMDLVGDPDAPRLVGKNSGADRTPLLRSWSERRVRRLEREGIQGFIVKSKSPSCGLRSAIVRRPEAPPLSTGRGIFTGVLVERLPLLPVEEEVRLHRPDVLENFIDAVFTLGRWQELLRSKRSKRALVRFHERHELLLRAHGERHRRAMERLLASGGEMTVAELYTRYGLLLFDALRPKATARKKAAALKRAMNRFGRELSAPERKELGALIDQYRRGKVDFEAPLSLLALCARRHDRAGIAGQVYLNPHPLELAARNR